MSKSMTIAFLALAAGCSKGGAANNDGGPRAGASGGTATGDGGAGGAGGGGGDGSGGSSVSGTGGSSVSGTGGSSVSGSGGSSVSGTGGDGSGGSSVSGTGGSGVSGTGGGSVSGAGGGGGAVAPGGSGGASGGVSGTGTGGTIVGACAQPWLGDIQTGTALDDEITGVTAPAGGGFYVTGYENGDTTSSDVIPAGDARAVIALYDSQGALIWKSKIDTPQADTAEDVQVDPASGNLIVLGRTSGALPGFQNAGQMDMYVSVLNSAGAALGAIQIGDERPQHPVRLGLGPNGKILVAGYDDIFIPSNFVAALEHGFLAELSDGTAPAFAPSEDFWHRSAYFNSPPPPPSIADFTTGVAVAATDGAVYLSSTVDGRADQRGMFVTKLDATGQTVWSTPLSTDAGDFAAAVGLSPNGDLIVAGTANPEIAGTEIGQQDAFVAKIDKATGAVLWAAAAGSTDSDFTTAMAFDAAGNIYVTGQTVGSVGGAPNKGGVDVFVAKIGPSGNVMSTWQRGSAGDDLAAAIAVDACGRVVVGGFTTGALIAGQPSAGGRDMFLVKADLD